MDPLRRLALGGTKEIWQDKDPKSCSQRQRSLLNSEPVDHSRSTGSSVASPAIETEHRAQLASFESLIANACRSLTPTASQNSGRDDGNDESELQLKQSPATATMSDEEASQKSGDEKEDEVTDLSNRWVMTGCRRRTGSDHSQHLLR